MFLSFNKFQTFLRKWVLFSLSFLDYIVCEINQENNINFRNAVKILQSLFSLDLFVKICSQSN